MPGPNRSRSVRLYFVPLFLAFCATSAPCHGKTNRPGQECTADNARPLSIAEASRNRKVLEQRCVKLTGLLDGSNLYQDIDDVYRDTEFWRDRDPDLRTVSRIGLRPFPDHIKLAASPPGVPRLTVVGRLHDCGRDWGVREEDNGDLVISMGSGWCHYNSGAVLTLTGLVAQESVSPVRKTGAKAWRRLGDIVPAKADSARAIEALAFLDSLLDAARRGDRRAVLDLHGYSRIALAADGVKVAEVELETGAGSDAQRMLDVWFGTRTVLSQALLNARRPDVRVFEPRWDPDDWSTIWACWGSVAEGDWPISSMDAVNVPGRPYACVKLTKELQRLDPVEEAWVARTFGGPAELREPAR